MAKFLFNFLIALLVSLNFGRFILAHADTARHAPTPDFQFLPTRHRAVKAMSTKELRDEFIIQRTRSRQYMAGRRTYGMPLGTSPFDEVGHERVVLRMSFILDELLRRCEALLEN
jgi:hypothetical protein